MQKGIENEIVQRCKSGDLNAFEELFNRYGTKLFSLCLRMSGNREDAEDLMQEIFVILFKKIHAFRGDARFTTWMYRIAVNTCISHLRKKKGIMVSADVELEKPKFAQNPAAVLQRTLLKKAIADLPPGYRSAVIMHDIQGFNHREIASILGISVGASKSQLFKARKKLREFMSSDQQLMETQSG